MAKCKYWDMAYLGKGSAMIRKFIITARTEKEWPKTVEEISKALAEQLDGAGYSTVQVKEIENEEVSNDDRT